MRHIFLIACLLLAACGLQSQTQSESGELNCRDSSPTCHANGGGQVVGHALCVANCNAAARQVAY